MNNQAMTTGGLIALLVTIWTLSYNYYGKICCSSLIMPLTITDGVLPVAASNDNFLFATNSAVPTMGEGVPAALTTAALYMNSNPDKVLLINGKRGADEADAALSQQRAEAVKAALVELDFPEDRLMTVDSAVGQYVLFYNEETSNSVDFKIRTLDFLNVSDGELSAAAPGNVRYALNGAGLEEPIDAEVLAGLQAVADHLKANPNRTLTLTGRYRAAETNDTPYPDLGIARANSLKNKLIELGAPAGQFELKSELDDDLLFLSNVMVGGVDYGFTEAADNSDRLAQIRSRLNANPLTVYFETNASSLNFSAEQRSYIADLVYYLDNVPGAGLQVIGHTDNRGDRRYNASLSRRRAEFVQDYLDRNGITDTRTTTVGRGIEAPIATNDTEEGRRLNRRVEVRLRE